MSWMTSNSCLLDKLGLSWHPAGDRLVFYKYDTYYKSISLACMWQSISGTWCYYSSKANEGIYTFMIKSAHVKIDGECRIYPNKYLLFV